METGEQLAHRIEHEARSRDLSQGGHLKETLIKREGGKEPKDRKATDLSSFTGKKGERIIC